jgi:hypothetical protein
VESPQATFLGNADILTSTWMGVPSQALLKLGANRDSPKMLQANITRKFFPIKEEGIFYWRPVFSNI